jgi:3',5'-cyclic AMP phosphodiesterase CpdA
MTAVLVVSDTHLAARTPEAVANWERIVDHVTATHPDLVVHLGDLTVDAADDPTQLEPARRLLDTLPVPWRAIPGNHDIGDNPISGGHKEAVITHERRARWIDTIGADWWSADLDGWTLVALDAQLFGSGLDAETEQGAWLDRTLTAIQPGVHVALALHKPLAPSTPERDSAPVYRYVPPAAERWIRKLMAATATPVVISGHVHQYRDIAADDRRYLWAPTSWAVIPDDVQPVIGAKRCGVLAVDLALDGVVDAVMVEPPGLLQHMTGADVLNPYA